VYQGQEGGCGRVVRLLGDPELSADFGYRRTVLDLLQRQCDLLI
jgi:hypothetical protein